MNVLSINQLISVIRGNYGTTYAFPVILLCDFLPIVSDPYVRGLQLKGMGKNCCWGGGGGGGGSYADDHSSYG